MAGGEEVRKFDQTPTWAVAGVCAVIIIVSIALEKILHKVGNVRCQNHLSIGLFLLFVARTVFGCLGVDFVCAKSCYFLLLP